MTLNRPAHFTCAAAGRIIPADFVSHKLERLLGVFYPTRIKHSEILRVLATPHSGEVQHEESALVVGDHATWILNLFEETSL